VIIHRRRERDRRSGGGSAAAAAPTASASISSLVTTTSRATSAIRRPSTLRLPGAAQGDPGYRATSVMLGEGSLCLALDGDRLPPRAGVLTPAAAICTAIVERLRFAGQTLEVERTG
jgi:short subunit dehydrogenase-like uncharacterized protein